MVSSPTPLDAASANLLISAATSLATEDPAAAQARWDALGGDDELLDAELAKYRAALGALSQRLRDLGGYASSRGGSEDGGEDAAGGGGAGAGAGGSGIDGVEGIEGVDYHLGSVDDLDPSEWHVPPHCIPVHANVTTYDWSRLINAFGAANASADAAAVPGTTSSACPPGEGEAAKAASANATNPATTTTNSGIGSGFDAIMMDPPWQLATANPTRGVALGYSQLTDADIENLPIPALQPRGGGYLFVWVINAKYKFCLDLFDKWGYDLVDEIVWVKSTVNRRLAKSHGYYLQHAKEVCLVGVKRGDGGGASGTATAAAATAALGSPAAAAAAARLSSCSALYPAEGVGSDIIFSERRGQSQKPEEIYQLVEAVCPGGSFLEIFGRKNNLRDFWVTVGNEVTGTGPPREDATVIAAGGRIPGAVYGAAGR